MEGDWGHLCPDSYFVVRPFSLRATSTLTFSSRPIETPPSLIKFFIASFPLPPSPCTSAGRKSSSVELGLTNSNGHGDEAAECCFSRGGTGEGGRKGSGRGRSGRYW